MELWKKVIGPFVFYFRRAPEPQILEEQQTLEDQARSPPVQYV